MSDPTASDERRAELLTVALGVYEVLGHPGSTVRQCWRAMIDARRRAETLGFTSVGKLLRHLANGLAYHADGRHDQPLFDREPASLWCERLLLTVTQGVDAAHAEHLLLATTLVPWAPRLERSEIQELLTDLERELPPAVVEAPVADAAAIPSGAFDAAQSAAPFALGVDIDAETPMLGPQADDSAGRPLALGAQDQLDTVPVIGTEDATARAAGETLASSSSPNAIATDEPIWISEDELAVTRAAIAQQVMPLAVELLSAEDATEQARLRDELGFQLGLIVNALELLGVPELRALLALVADRIAAPDAEPHAVMTVAAGLLGVLEQPGAESAAVLVGATAELGLASEALLNAVQGEIERLRIGRDPKRVQERQRSVRLDALNLSPAPDVTPSVLASMLRDLPGHAERLGLLLRELAQRHDAERLDEARRIAHTLKGDANTVGIYGLGQLMHALEDVLVELVRTPERLDAAVIDALVELGDAVEECADAVLGRGPPPADLAAWCQRALDLGNALHEGSALPVAAEPSAGPARAEGAAAANEEATPAVAQETLNVDLRLLDQTQNLAGELLILGRRVERQAEILTRLQNELWRAANAERELSTQLDELVTLRGAALRSTALQAGAALDPLELDQYNELHTVARRIAEANTDQLDVARRFETLLLDLGGLIAQQSRLNDEVQAALGRTRMRPFSEIVPRLERVVRQTARRLEKQVDLEIAGGEIGVDAEVLDRLVEPIAHLLRNAVDHGIEAPAERRAAGKLEVGRIRIDVTALGDSIVLRVADDGRGYDLERIRARAVELGLLAADQSPSADLLTRLILLPGFSTRSEVTETSGRGVGMDVVNLRVRALRGTLTLASTPGRGVSATLRLPISQRVADLVAVRGHGVQAAIAAAAVERIVSITPDQIRYDVTGAVQVEIDGRWLPLRPIESLYGRSGDLSLPTLQSCLGLILNTLDDRRVVISALDVLEINRMVLKPLADWLPTIPGVRGLTQLRDGSLAAVLEPLTLLELIERSPEQLALAQRLERPAVPRIVVADDSTSVRRALEQLLQDAGYEVTGARDGVEALQAIEQTAPAAVLLDLEMPRLNGLEVCRHLRSQSHTRSIPVVMITSRTGEKYQLLAEQAGVTELLSKPVAEDQLLHLVRELIQATA